MLGGVEMAAKTLACGSADVSGSAEREKPMAINDAGINARSWLFAPGDSERKMEKATAGSADIVLLDLEDAVVEAEKPKARSMVAAFLKANAEQRARLWVRINPLQGPHALADLVAIMPARPGGIMLPKARGRAEVDRLDHYLTALEAAAGARQGDTKVIVLVTETAEAMFTTGSYAGAPRLVAMTWGAEDLADALGASENRNKDGSYGFTYELARSLCLLGAAAAGVSAIETMQGDFRDEVGLRKRAAQVRRAGYRGMLAIHPAQVDVINAAFTPSAEELASAQEIVDLFAANPTAGTIGHKGAMLDRPYLARAQALLAAARRAADR
jgi:citrate lyase subunit beta / citryl-CoA lyase